VIGFRLHRVVVGGSGHPLLWYMTLSITKIPTIAMEAMTTMASHVRFGLCDGFKLSNMVSRVSGNSQSGSLSLLNARPTLQGCRPAAPARATVTA